MKKLTLGALSAAFTVAILSVLLAIGGVLVFGQTTDKPGDGDKSFGKRGMQKRFGRRGMGGPGRRGMRGPRRGFMHRRVFAQLNLTDQQKTQIQSIMKSSRESGRALRQQKRKNMQEFRNIENPSDAQVQEFAKKQGDLHSQMILQRHKTKAQMHGVLTSEQKQKLAEMKANFKKKMEERKAKRAARRSENKSTP